MFRGAYYNSGMSINYNTILKKYNVKAKIESISIDTHQLHYNPLHHFIIKS